MRAADAGTAPIKVGVTMSSSWEIDITASGEDLAADALSTDWTNTRGETVEAGAGIAPKSGTKGAKASLTNRSASKEMAS
jgi:hypothetical protein